ncbi:uncharacterized protein E0L32_008846 [Thyridium curvatum]|uniref:Uncharacterized protein n=1 Tax=Thyridium curvatum TaxID=1093900 RepID=A0A507AYA0_9PEZI|nr:uncharacterized protein E0L32_008846 [Thyridium curvatum]TPX09999.1 hypothetical protein E0L32_008846 [Thyridium curvatum]
MSWLCCCQRRPQSRPRTLVEIHSSPCATPSVKLDHVISFPGDAPFPTCTPKTSSVTPIPGAPSEPQEVEELIVDESDDEHGAQFHLSRPKSTSTLEFVKTKIQRHLSVDSIRGPSLQTTAYGPETAARRAELRRLMHKRIWDELQSEDHSKAQEEQDAGPDASLSQRDLLPGGPRDMVEFSILELVEDPTRRSSGVASHAQLRPELEGKDFEKLFNLTKPDRRASCPGRLTRDTSHHMLSILAGRTRNVSLPQLPRPASTTSLESLASQQSLESWTLSMNPDQLNTILSLGEDPSRRTEPSAASMAQKKDSFPSAAIEGTIVPHITDDTPSDRAISETGPMSSRDESPVIHPGNHEQCPLSTWLRSQGLSSGARSFAFSEGDSQDSNEIHEARLVKIGRPNSMFHNINDRDGEEGLRPRTVHLCDMNIPKQLESQSLATSTTSPVRRAVGLSHIRGPSLLTQESRISSLNLQHGNAIDDSLMHADPQTSHVGQTQNSVSRSSSVYTASHCSHISIATSTHQHAILGTHEKLGNEGVLVSSSQKPDVGLGAHFRRLPVFSRRNSAQPYGKSSRRFSLQAPPSQFELQRGRNSSPITASETSSFRRREAELQAIEKRFENSELRRRPKVSVPSKFREEEEIRGSPDKYSVFSKIHLAVPRKARLSLKHHGHTEGAQDHTTIFQSIRRCSSLRSTSNRRVYPSIDPNVLAVVNLREDTAKDNLTATRQGDARNTSRRARLSKLPRKSNIPQAKRLLVKDNPSNLSTLELKPDCQYGSPAPITQAQLANPSSDAQNTPLAEIQQPICEEIQFHAAPSHLSGRQPGLRLSSETSSDVAVVLAAKGSPETLSQYPCPIRDSIAGIAGTDDSALVRDYANVSSLVQDSSQTFVNNKPFIRRSASSNTRGLPKKLGSGIRRRFDKLMAKNLDSPVNENVRSCMRSSCHDSEPMDYPRSRALATEGHDHAFSEGQSPDALADHTSRITSNTSGNENAELIAGEPVAFEDTHSSSSSGIPDRSPQMPCQRWGLSETSIRGHTAESTAATGNTERYATPLSRISVYHDAGSRRYAASDTFNADLEIASTKSDAPTMRKTKSTTTLNKCGREDSMTKFQTWGGRSKTQPVLMSSTLEYGQQLEEALQQEKDKVQEWALVAEMRH